VIDAYTFRFETARRYAWLAVRIEGMLQFERGGPFYRTVHQSPCAWNPVAYLNARLADVHPGQGANCARPSMSCSTSPPTLRRRNSGCGSSCMVSPSESHPRA